MMLDRLSSQPEAMPVTRPRAIKSICSRCMRNCQIAPANARNCSISPVRKAYSRRLISLRYTLPVSIVETGRVSVSSCSSICSSRAKAKSLTGRLAANAASPAFVSIMSKNTCVPNGRS